MDERFLAYPRPRKENLEMLIKLWEHGKLPSTALDNLVTSSPSSPVMKTVLGIISPGFQVGFSPSPIPGIPRLSFRQPNSISVVWCGRWQCKAHLIKINSGSNATILNSFFFFFATTINEMKEKPAESRLCKAHNESYKVVYEKLFQVCGPQWDIWHPLRMAAL